MNNILLCGFMGCGKTTVGKRLAKLSRLEYLDLDEEIELEAGMRIPELFERYGEAHFRDLEHQAICALSKRIGCVVSTGGGAMTFPRNVAAVDQRDTVVFLDAPFDICYGRIRESDRPIVRAKPPEALRALFDERRARYAAAAGLTVAAGGEADEIAARIIKLLQN